MGILKTATTGTLGPSNTQVMAESGEQGIELAIESSVTNQYGHQIKVAVLEILDTLGVSKGAVEVVNKGALECTLKARVRYTVHRNCGAVEKNISWGSMVKWFYAQNHRKTGCAGP